MRDPKLGGSLCSLLDGRRNFKKLSEFMAGNDLCLHETRDWNWGLGRGGQTQVQSHQAHLRPEGLGWGGPRQGWKEIPDWFLGCSGNLEGTEMEEGEGMPRER